MARIESLTPTFVKYIPKVKEEGLLYISMVYATANHLCCCGCGVQTVTPLSPDGWLLTFDGVSVSLTPSIANRFPCRSHYWITDNQVRWA